MNRLDNIIHELEEIQNDNKEEEEITFTKEDVEIILKILCDVRNSIRIITGSGF